MKRAIRLLIASAVMLPAALQAQTPEEQVARTLERARQAGLPVQLLESKIAEGTAKGIPMQRIAQAVTRRFEVLQRVQTAVGERNQLNAEEMGVAADALHAGVTEAVLKAVSETAPREWRAVAIAAVSQLVQMGHASDEALAQVAQALARGPEALMNLPAQAAGAAARRGPPQGVPAAGGPGEQGRSGPPAGVPTPPVKPPVGKPGGGPPGGG